MRVANKPEEEFEKAVASNRQWRDPAGRIGICASSLRCASRLARLIRSKGGRQLHDAYLGIGGSGGGSGRSKSRVSKARMLPLCSTMVEISELPSASGSWDRAAVMT